MTKNKNRINSPMGLRICLYVVLVMFASCRKQDDFTTYYEITGQVKEIVTKQPVAGIQINLHYSQRGMGILSSSGVVATAITDGNGYYKIKYQPKDFHLDTERGSLCLELAKAPKDFVTHRNTGADIDQKKVKMGEKLIENFEVAKKTILKMNIKVDNLMPNEIFMITAYSEGEGKIFHTNCTTLGFLNEYHKINMDKTVNVEVAANTWTKISKYKWLPGQVSGWGKEIKDSIFCQKDALKEYTISF